MFLFMVMNISYFLILTTYKDNDKRVLFMILLFSIYEKRQTKKMKKKLCPFRFAISTSDTNVYIYLKKKKKKRRDIVT